MVPFNPLKHYDARCFVYGKLTIGGLIQDTAILVESQRFHIEFVTCNEPNSVNLELKEIQNSTFAKKSVQYYQTSLNTVFKCYIICHSSESIS